MTIPRPAASRPGGPAPWEHVTKAAGAGRPRVTIDEVRGVLRPYRASEVLARMRNCVECPANLPGVNVIRADVPRRRLGAFG